MKKNFLPAVIALMVMIGSHLSAMAQTDNVPPASVPQVVTQTPIPASTEIILPKLNFTWDCGKCVQNEKVIPLIEQAYVAEAKSNGLAISDTDTAEVAIIDIRQRPPGVRVMFGIMAGKDRLGLRIRYKDNEYFVDDYSANIAMGLNHLSESVGKKAYASLTRESN